jgi:hypothetical protein
MKSQIKYIFLLTGILFSISCNDLLDLKPITEELETNYYKNEQECFQGLASVYDVLQWGAVATPGTGAASIPFEWISEIMSDKCYAGGDNATDGATMEHFNRGTLNGDISNVKSLWKKYYTGIYRANLLLEKLPQAEFTKAENRTRFEAECKFLRAYFYFDLVRLFENIPLVTKTLSSKEYNQSQAAPADVYVQIARDLQFAGNHLNPYNELPANELGRVTKSAAQGLLMRVWLYYTGYYNQPQLSDITFSDILSLSEDLINRSGHDLLSNYADLFSPKNKNNKESLFEIQFSEKSYSGWDNANREVADGNLSVLLWSMRLNAGDKSKYADGWSFAPIAIEYYQMFSDVDARKAASFVVPAAEGVNYRAGYQDAGIFPRKWAALKEYQSPKGDVRVNYPYNLPVIRFSDVLLMASELNLKTGGDRAKALTYYAKVRQRAMGASANVPSVDLDLLYTERELEFACEGLRYWDLMRRGLDYAKQKIDKSDPSGKDIFVRRFNYEAKGLLPIPSSEIINTNYTLHQNKGYL